VIVVRMIVRVLGVAAAAAALLLAAVAVLMAPGLAVGGLAVAAFVGILVDLGARSVRAAELRRSAAAARRRGVAAGAATLAAWLVVAGLLIVVGSTTWIVVLTVVLAAAATRWGRRNRSPVWAPAPVVLSQLPTPELCLVWQRSCRALLDGPDGRGRAEVVRMRAELLDELERRDHDGFTRWLQAGPSAGGDPGRFLTTGG
jgi:hypothetical protein